MSFDAAAITQIILLVLSSIGVTQLAKRAVEKGTEVKLSPLAKQTLAVVFGLGLAITTGQDVNELLPGGMATDGALAGIVGTFLYSLIAKKPNPQP